MVESDAAGVDPFISLTGRILGFVVAQVRSQSDDLQNCPRPTSPPRLHPTRWAAPPARTRTGRRR